MIVCARSLQSNCTAEGRAPSVVYMHFVCACVRACAFVCDIVHACVRACLCVTVTVHLCVYVRVCA